MLSVDGYTLCRNASRFSNFFSFFVSCGIGDSVDSNCGSTVGMVGSSSAAVADAGTVLLCVSFADEWCATLRTREAFG